MATVAEAPGAAAVNEKPQESKPADAAVNDNANAVAKANANADSEKTSDVKDTNGSAKIAQTDGANNDDEKHESKRKDRGNHRRGGRSHDWRGGQGGRRNNRNNVKTQFDKRPESSNADEIRRQVEFYFSDSNLPTDAFLLNAVGGVENKPVPLEKIHTFKRMRNFQPYSAVVEAVKNSEHLQVDENGCVSRKTPLPAKFTMSVEENNKLLTSDSMKRSIYAKGFGREGENTAFDIENFFRPYKINGVRLRRYDNGFFKGSVFVEFVSEENCQDFLNLDPKPEYQGAELIIKGKKEYIAEKNEAIKNGEVKPRSPTRFGDQQIGTRRAPGRVPGPYKRSREDEKSENWRDRRARFQDKRRKLDEDADDKKAEADDKNDPVDEQMAETGTDPAVAEKPEEATDAATTQTDAAAGAEAPAEA